LEVVVTLQIEPVHADRVQQAFGAQVRFENAASQLGLINLHHQRDVCMIYGKIILLRGEEALVRLSVRNVLNGLPSDLLRQRPDTRRAERELAGTARIGVAAADLYPRFFLTGAAGLCGNLGSPMQLHNGSPLPMSVTLNDNSPARSFMYQAIDAAADSITFAISGALEIKLTWLAFNSFVFAFMRFAMNRSKSGLMALS